MIRRLIKISLYALLAVGLLVVILLALTQTRFFKDWVRDKIVDVANQSLTARLTIDRIDGNLFWHTEIVGLSLIDEPDTIVYIPRIIADYSPRGLLAGEIYIDSIYFDSPRLAVRERPDSTWNVAELILPDSMAVVEPGVSEEPFGFDILLNNFRLDSGTVAISTGNPDIPRRIDNLFIDLEGRFHDDRLEIRLSDLRFKTVDPSLELRRLSLNANLDSTRLAISNIDLQTAQNRFDGDAAITLSEPFEGEISIRTDRLVAGEFSVFSPMFDEIRAYPSVNFGANLSRDTLSVQVDVEEGDQAVNLASIVAGFNDLISDSSGSPGYQLDLRITGVDAARWSGNPEWNYLLNGKIGVKGQGIDPESSHGTWFADFGGFQVKGRRISEIHSKGEYNNGSLDGKLDVKGEFGEINASVAIEDVLNRQEYRVAAEIRDLNAALLTFQDDLQSDLNARIQFDGQGLKPEEMRGTFALDMAPSVLRGIEINSMVSRVQISDGIATLDSLAVETGIAEFSMTGDVSLKGEIDARFRSRLIDPDLLNRYFEVGEVKADGTLEGTVKGRPDSLSCTVNYDLAGIEYDGNKVEFSNGQIAAVIKDSEILEGEISAAISGIMAGDFAVQSIDLDGRLFDQSMEVDVRAAIDSNITAHVEAIISADSVIRIVLPMVDARYYDYHFVGGSPDMAVVIEDETYHFHEFRLTGEGKSLSPQAEVALEGMVSLTGEEDFRLSLSGLALDSLNLSLGPDMGVGGVVSLEAGITGSATLPEITGELTVTGGRLSKYNFNEVTCQLAYQADSLSWRADLRLPDDHELTTSGYLPVSISLPDSVVVLTGDRMRAELKTDSIPFGLLSIPVGQLKNTQGILSCELHFENTLANPLLTGNLQLEGGGFDIPRVGVSLRDIKSELTADGQRINLDYLRAEREDGYLQMSGYVDVTDSLIYGRVNNGELTITADKFYLMRHKDYDAKISADIGVNIVNDSISYLGSIDVLRSSLYLPAIADIGGNLTDDDVTVPLLVAATSQPSGPITDSLGEDLLTPDAADESLPSLIDRVKGRLQIEIPRNTWLKGPEMRLELSGRVESVQDGEDIRLFGSVNVVRGQYSILGKRLKINRGIVSFAGREELNPDIDVECEYEIRGKNRDRKHLQLYITGKLDSLALSFALDNRAIEQDDAVSYLLFGSSMDELSSGQQTGVQGLIAMDMASNLASAQLSKLAGEQLALDYIEIYAQDNWQSATFVVGKYFTDKIFMSYERVFEERSGGELAPEKIIVEYELTRKLALRLVTGSTNDRGADLLIRLERK